MAVRLIPDRFGVGGARYHLVRFDKDGHERNEPGGHSGIDAVLEELRGQPESTDVFLICHGWNGDEQGAMAQYDAWVSQMIRNQPEIARSFRPLIIGIHWPSKAWGDDRIVDVEGEPGTIGIKRAVDTYASVLSDKVEVREAMTSIFSAVTKAGEESETDRETSLPDELAICYQTVRDETNLKLDENSRTAAVWSPHTAFDTAWNDTDPSLALAPIDDRSWAERFRDALLAPMRQLSFWTMKDRARTVGEVGVHPFLMEMQKIAEAAATPSAPVRFHMVGHSFGCIVVSAGIAGPPSAQPVQRKVHSLLLLQGALSIWAFAKKAPRTDQAGYFRRILDQRLVLGPIVTTRSKIDFAVGRFYPIGAGIARQIVLGEDDDPIFGGLGAFGIRGVPEAKQATILPPRSDYAFARGVIYNVDATAIIATRRPVEGAHNDIVHPEVANLAWQAAMATG